MQVTVNHLNHLSVKQLLSFNKELILVVYAQDDRKQVIIFDFQELLSRYLQKMQILLLIQKL